MILSGFVVIFYCKKCYNSYQIGTCKKDNKKKKKVEPEIEHLLFRVRNEHDCNFLIAGIQKETEKIR